MPPPPPPPTPATEEDEEEERTDDDETDEYQWGESSEEEDVWEEELEDGEEEESEEEDNDDGDGEEEDVGVEECRRENGRGGAGRLLSAAAAVADEEHGAKAAGSDSCCVCMEPWNSDGAHRICCIPCGHVYGRSCLERWLRRCGNTSAKCPQCGQRYRHKHITDLYVSGNVRDSFCHLQIQELVARLRSDIAEARAKIRADVQSDIDKAHAKLAAELTSLFERAPQSNWEESAQGAAAVVEAEFLSMKEQLRKMADEQNATPMDMLRFMEQNGAKLWESISSRPPAATTTVED